MHEETQESSVN